MKPTLVFRLAGQTAQRAFLGVSLAVMLLFVVVGIGLADSDGWNGVADVRAFDERQMLTPLALVNIGDYVWNDPNEDGEHLSADGEGEFTAGIPGVVVNLCEDTILDGEYTSGDACTRQTSTDATGKYLFVDVPADGTLYFVVLDDSNFTGTGALVDRFLTSKDTYGDGYEYIIVPLTETGYLDADFGFADPQIQLEKIGSWQETDGDFLVEVGELIQYTFTVSNPGDVDLFNVTVADSKVTAVSCPGGYPIPSLPAGTSVVCTGSYALLATDLAAGHVLNEATACGTDTLENQVCDPDDYDTLLPAIEIVKTGSWTDSNANKTADVGDVIDYTFVVTNIGDVTLTGVTVTDPKVASITCPQTTLAVSESMTCTGSYALQAADITAGNVLNTATACGLDGTDKVCDPDDNDTPLPAIQIVKTGSWADSNANKTADVGDVIDYTFAVTNIGKVTLTNVAVTDPKVSPITCPKTTLTVGESMTCTGSYALLATDITAGNVLNTATACGLDDPDQVCDPDDNDTPLPAIEVIKTGSWADSNGNKRADVGDVIEYSFLVTNIGEVPLTGVTVTDPKVAPITCPQTTLAVGESMTCTGSYALTADDVTAGNVLNTATACGLDDPDQVCDPDDEDTPLPAIEIIKTGDWGDSNTSKKADVGDLISYTFVVTNIGEVPLTGVTVTDPKVAPITCPQTTLAVGESMTCTGSYALTADDVTAGNVLNTATACGLDGPDQVCDPDDEDTPLPAIQIVKTGSWADGDGNGLAEVGELINYTFAVTNIGEVPLTGVTVTDPKVAPITCPQTTLAVGESMTCTGSYVLKAADIAAGNVLNTATACGLDDPDQVCDPDDEDTPLPQLAIIGDFVWWDLIRNGLQDSSELGIPNVTVQLYDSTGLIDEVETDGSGLYEFTVPPGAYTVKIADSEFGLGGALPFWEATEPNIGTDDTIDSDGDKTTHSATVTVGVGETDLTIDFGFAEKRTGVTLAGYSVTAADGGVFVAWETASEVDIAGFSVERGDALVAEFIAAEHAGADGGASYSVLDAAPGAGSYILVIYKLDGSAERVELGS